MKKIKTNYIFVGLGNPGVEYEKSRHSIGRNILLSLQSKPIGDMECKAWREDKKMRALMADGKLGTNKFIFVLPNNFMNNSGASVKPLIKTKADINRLALLQDDLDLPLGVIKISYNRSSGGHKGVESIVKAVKSQEFTRVRIGIAPVTPSGKIKKPSADKVVDFVIADFKVPEQDKLKKAIKSVKEIIASLVEQGLERTMNSFN